jgi:hypothetical protein
VFGAHISADSDAVALDTIVRVVSLAAGNKVRELAKREATDVQPAKAATASGHLCRR